jgi:DNA-binding NtrC family response regulator
LFTIAASHFAPGRIRYASVPNSTEPTVNTELLIREGEQLKLRTKKLRIEVLTGPNAGLMLEVPGDDARIGTGRGCHVLLFDPAVSRHHLTLRASSEGVRVIDGGSRNGTLLDGVRIRDAHARPDSVIAIGNSSLRLRMLDEYVDVPLSAREQIGGLIGQSVAMRRIFTLLERVAETDDPVLIEGETGTGKELAAEAIHEESRRGSEAFVVFDCSAVSPNLIESELFGHVRGAFSGAVADREGAFEAAADGTLFLDEVGELPLTLQPKLLRALERLEVRRVGSNEVRKVDVRVIAATNRNLAEEAAQGRFREDLYYRLAVVALRMPPLRERPEDIPLLVEHFLSREKHRERTSPASNELVARFRSQAWPGNVRELKNAILRSLTVGVPAVIPNHAPKSVQAPAIDLSVPLREARDRLADGFEEAYLREALRSAGGNATRAAELAGINRKYIQRAIKKYGLRERG